MNAFYRNIFARVQFEALGGNSEKLLTLCIEQGIPLSNVKPVAGGFTASAPARRYRQISRLARRCRTRLRLQKKQGFYFLLKKYRWRYGLLVGAVAFLVAVQAFGGVVWAIRWDGATKTQQTQISALLYSMDIYEGVVLTQENLQAAEKQLYEQADDLGWVALNFEKGRLVVEVVTTRDKPEIEPNDAVNLVAAADAVIVETNVQEGFLLKNVGQTVAKGETLISAVTFDRNGRAIYTHAKGEVLAEVKCSYQCEQPITLSGEAPTGEIITSRALRMANWRLSLGADLLQDEAAAKLRHEPVEILGFGLPITLEERYQAVTAPWQKTLTEQEALSYARYACRQQMYGEYPGAQVLTISEEYAMEGENLVYRVNMQIKADIARGFFE